MEENLDVLSGQWSVLLAAKNYHCSGLDEKTFNTKLSSIKGDSASKDMMSKGVEMLRTYNINVISQMFKSVSATILALTKTSSFPRLFVSIVKSAHALILLPLGEKTNKHKAIHTDQLVNEEAMTELEVLSCEVFEFLSGALEAAVAGEVDLSTLDKELTTIIFTFMDPNQPSKVRVCAGKIISAMSKSANLCEEITKTFWQKFSKLKKDDEYRNFASWIDGIVNLQLSLAEPEIARVTISFLQKFNEYAKKIERGVLRMKFLDALAVMLSRIKQSPEAAKNADYNKQLDDIWNVVEKWSKKEKHTEFCYKFLQRMLRNTHDSFFLQGHGNTFIDQICKYSKKEGPIEGLKMIMEFVKAAPDELTKKNRSEFERIVKTYIFHLIFPSEDGKMKLRFTTPEQKQIATQILAEVAAQQMDIFINFGNTVFVPSDKTPDAKLRQMRLVVIESIMKIGKIDQTLLDRCNDEISRWIQPILLRNPVATEEEYAAAVIIYPMVYPKDPQLQMNIAERLFEEIRNESLISSSAFSALCQYIERLINLKDNSTLPIDFCSQLLDKISCAPMDKILRHIALLMGLTESMRTALEKCKDSFTEVAEGRSPITKDVWCNFRKKFDSEVLIMLLSGEESVSQLTYDFAVMYHNDVFAALDKICLPETYYSIPVWCSTIPKEGDLVNYAHVINNASEETANEYFNSVYEFLCANQGLDVNYVSKILTFMGTLVRPNTTAVTSFFTKLFNLLKTDASQLALAGISKLHPCVWSKFLNDLDNWMESMITHIEFWPSIVLIFHTLCLRQEFEEAVKEEHVMRHCKRFCRRFWEDYGKVNATFVVTEKAMKTVTTILEKSEFKVMVERESIAEFLLSVREMCDLSMKSDFTLAYPATFMTLLVTVFKYVKFQSIKQFVGFRDVIIPFGLEFVQNDHVKTLIAQLFTTILITNPLFITTFLVMTFHENTTIRVAALLAFGNTLSARKDFVAEYKDGIATVLTAMLVHIDDHDITIRQAAFKLLCSITSMTEGVYNKEVPTNMIMTLTSPDAVGYTMQADLFVEFIAGVIKPVIAYNIFNVITKVIKWKKDQHRPIELLLPFIPIMIKGAPIQSTITTMITLSGECRASDSSTTLAVKNLWTTYIRNSKEQFPGQQHELIETVFKYATSQESLSSNEAQNAVIVLSYIFYEYPEETAKFLLPYVLEQYDMTTPGDMSTFCDFLNGASIMLKPTKDEIIASNALSQIFLMIEKRDLFISLFGAKLEVLVLAAIMSKPSEEYNMGQFHPLLDSLLDAALFRFAKDNSTFSSNLAVLQEKNLIKRATSLNEQYMIGMDDGSKNIVAYDEELIQALAKLFGQVDASFSNKFFSKLMSFAFQIEKHNPRAAEPFMMIMAIGREMSTDALYYLLLFTIYICRVQYIELMDVLVDCVKGHMLALPLDSDAFEEESMPVMILLILYLGLNIKTSLAVHIMHIIGDISRRIKESPRREAICKAICCYLQKFDGDKFVALHFVRFISQATTFGDDTTKVMIQTLDDLSSIFEDENDWCSLIALVMEGCRYFIGKRGTRMTSRALPHVSFESIEEFTTMIRERFTRQDQRAFTLSFLCNVLSSFNSIDLAKDSAVLMLIASLCSNGFAISNESLHKLLRFLSLVSVTSDEEGRKAAGPLIAKILEKADHAIEKEFLSLAMYPPNFVTVKQRQYNQYLDHERVIVDPKSLPRFTLLEDAVADDVIIDSVWNFILQKIGEEAKIFVQAEPVVTEEEQEVTPDSEETCEPVTTETVELDEKEITEAKAEEETPETPEEEVTAVEAPKLDELPVDTEQSSDKEPEVTEEVSAMISAEKEPDDEAPIETPEEESHTEESIAKSDADALDEEKAPEEEKAEECAEEEKTEESPEEEKADECADEKTEDSPEEEKAEESPDEEKAEECAEEEKAEECTDEEKAEESPEEEKAEECAEEEKTEESPEEEKAEECAEEEKAEDSSNEESAEDSSDEESAEVSSGDEETSDSAEEESTEEASHDE